MLFTRNSIFDDLFDTPYYRVEGMETDIIETKDGYRFEIEVPGFAKEDLGIEFEKGNLTIKATAKEVEGKYIRQERSNRNMQRTFYVGDYLTEEDIKASYNNGVLVIEVPKYETKAALTRKAISID